MLDGSGKYVIWRQRNCALACLGSVAVVYCLGGCGNGLNDVDRRVDRLLNERSAELQGDSKVPDRKFGEPPTHYSKDVIAKDIPTNNPPAAELKYSAADESRDVEARLLAYAAEATVSGPSEPIHVISLFDALRISQQSANEYLTAEETYILAAIRLLIERHLWGPRFFNDTTATMSGAGTDGNFVHAARIINDLRVQKKLPYGGQVEAAWVWQATDQLREQATSGYIQSSELTLAASIPLLRGAGTVAQESLIQSERNLIYAARNFESARRDLFVQIASDYFDLLEQRAQIQNTKAQIENLKRIERGQIALFNAGRVAEFRKNTAANDVLQATESLASQTEAYLLALDRFKIRLGLNPAERIDLDDALPIFNDPGTTLAGATELALEYRLDLQNRRDQVDDARRAVKNAQNDLLPDLNTTARVGFPTDTSENVGNLAFDPGDINYQAAVTLGLPLDRKIEQYQLRQATINLDQRERDYAQFRDQVAVGVRQALRNIDLARFQLRLAEERVKINERRVKEVELKSAEVDAQTQVDAANSLQESRVALDRAPHPAPQLHSHLSPRLRAAPRRS
jgi:outer membrane protein TolC